MNIPFTRLKIFKSIVFLFISFYAFGVQENLPQFKNDSIINNIISIRDEAIKQFKLGKVNSTIEKLELGLKLYSENNIEDNTLLFGLYVDLSNAYGNESIRNEKKSIEYVEKAKSLAERTDVKTYDLINFYVSEGSNKFDDGVFDEALGYINLAYSQLEEKNNELIKEIGVESSIMLKANLLEWFVSINFSVGNEQELLASHQRLEQYFINNSSNRDVEYYYALGSFRAGRYYQNKNVTKAAYYFDKSEQKGDKNLRLYSIICKGFAFLSAKAYDRIPTIIDKLEVFKDLNKFQELNLHEIATRYYSETNQTENLIKHTNSGLTLLNSNGKSIDVLNFRSEDFSPIIELKYPILLNQFALFLEQSKDPILIETSNELFKIALKQFDNRIDRKPSNNHFVNYDIIRNRNLKWLITSDASLDKKQDVLSQMERIENRAALNRIAFNRNLADNKTKLDSLISVENSIREQITLLKQQQIETDSILDQELFEQELKLKELKSKLVEENPTVYGLNSYEFNLSSITLDDNTKIFKYLKTEDKLYRIVILNSNIIIKDLGLYNQIEKEVSAFLNKVKDYSSNEDTQTLSPKLYNTLIGNEEILEYTTIIADGILSYLPFELLSKDNKYLIEKTAISYAQGLSYINPELYKPKTYDENIALFAPSYSNFIPTETELAVRGEPYNLIGATEEVSIINNIIGGLVYKNENASKSQFFNMPNNVAILHLAGHAFLNDSDPELSSIIFSDNEQDNKLFISELYGFKSNAELAVLSACNTGVGGYNNGESIVSLSQAFTYSGIPSTLSSLWNAPDNSTKEIMVSFYNNLSEGFSKSEALRNAKIEYLKQHKNSKLNHPFYWAGFVLYGNDAPIMLNKNFETEYFLLFGTVLLAIAGFIVWKKKRLK